MNTEVTKFTDRREARETVPQRADVTPMDLLRIATSQGADIEKLEKLMDLQQRWQREEARRAYTEAMAAFHVEPPQLVKNKHVGYDHKDGRGRTDYWHATHDEVTGKIGAALAKHGLAFAWRTRQEQAAIYVTCTVTHALGHSESFELFGSPDTSGLKSPLQAVASTITFLQRYTLLGATGLSTSELRDADDDARTIPPEPEPEGYAKWKADMEARADEGLAQFTESWAKAKYEFRRYVIKFDEAWFNDVRAEAPK